MVNDWWKTFFNEDYLFFWNARGNFKNTKKEIDFLVKNIPLNKNSRILDLCCGHGRHSIELARRGFRVTGLDYSAFELGLARREAERLKLDIEFIKGDARKFNFSQKFDVILNLFTAFGYGSKEDDRKIIQSISKNLKSGGVFFIDLMNLPWLLRNYKPKAKEQYKDSLITYERHFNFLQGINNSRTVIQRHGKRKVHQETLRAYSLSQLAELLESEGLNVEKFWGSFDGKKLGLDTKRMLVLARKE